jgi:hypothetical protein
VVAMGPSGSVGLKTGLSYLLLVPQSKHRINGRSSMRRDVAGEHGNDDRDSRADDMRGHFGWFHPVRAVRQNPRPSKRDDNPDPSAQTG